MKDPTAREHKTERGALLAALEHRCIKPGLWEVEGYRVERLPQANSWGKWLCTRIADPKDNHLHVNFTAALRWIADR
ncbi:hypothetical protein [Amycolatopsis sp. cmx-4-54]|uniref:hypothetical protein n=1 Tax=Amycolatopsis sp. cmx-4-54 TaxID=2790936 RepID=UPI00397D881A